jgi:hypothetical protein
MTETYRKHGTVVRWDHGVIVRIEEAGEAVETGRIFRSRPIEPASPLAELDASAVEAAAAEIEAGTPREVILERAIVSEGLARHEVGSSRWDERTRRVHLSLVHRSAGLRAMVDTANFDPERIVAIAGALAHVDRTQRSLGRVRLAVNVTAALLPSMVRHNEAGVRFFQTAGGLDGRGMPIVDHEITSERWPNWYRPSYRVRPVRSPLNIRVEAAERDVDPDLPQAVALLAPPAGREVRLLCTDSDSVFTAAVTIRRIRAAGPKWEWFPYGAGSWGAEMELEVS